MILQKKVLDLAIFYWIILHVFFISWLGYLNQSESVLICLILIRLVFDFKYALRLHSLYAGFLFCVIYPLFSYIYLGGVVEKLVENVTTIFSTTLLFIYLSFICTYKRRYAYEFMLKSKHLFNGYMIINVPILLLQLSGVTNLSGRHSESIENTYFEDMISGLLGYNGTGLLAMYFSFLILYNYIWLYKDNFKKKKFLIYNVALSLVMVIVSTKSDNKAMLILPPLFVLVFTILSLASVHQEMREKIRKIVQYMCVTTAVLAICLVVLQYWLGTVDIILDVISKMQFGWENADQAYGSAERLGIITYVLNNPKIRWIGVGLANMFWKEERGFGFAHFGISDFGSFLCLGGIFFVTLCTVFLYTVYCKIFRWKAVSTTFVTITLAVLIYTQMFTTLSISISWFFISISIAMGLELNGTKGKRVLKADLYDSKK